MVTETTSTDKWSIEKTANANIGTVFCIVFIKKSPCQKLMLEDYPLHH